MSPLTQAKRAVRQGRERSQKLIAWCRAADKVRAKANKLDKAHGPDLGVGDAYLAYMTTRLQQADAEYAANAKRQTPDRWDRP